MMTWAPDRQIFARLRAGKRGIEARLELCDERVNGTEVRDVRVEVLLLLSQAFFVRGRDHENTYRGVRGALTRASRRVIFDGDVGDPVHA